MPELMTQPSVPVRKIGISLPDTGLEEWEATRSCYETGWLTQGPQVAAFEAAFAKQHGVRHAIATTSCTTGLHLALAAMGVGPGDEVIVPAFTWVATANVVLYCGATPVFVDVDPVTFNLDVAQVAPLLSERTRAIIPVHLFGLCADMTALKALLPAHVKILGDAACAIGASLNGVMAGALGDAAVFSLHPRKMVTTGEGGMVTTNDDALAETMRQLRNHGASVSEEERHAGPKPYLLPAFNLLGFNYRMTDMQGAMGSVQLAKLPKMLQERHQAAAFYQQALAEISWLRTPTTPEGYEHGWQAYVCWVDPATAPMPRNDLMERLQQAGISTRPGTHAVHMLGYYAERYGLSPNDFPGARDCDAHSLAIPLHNRMSQDDYQYVVDVLKSV
ncbi:MAG: DegT/DnrJ/EryC1/StrS family aminotransferase [Candidatus Melainabacteria bacterium]|nr:DegT/DnrJ/EryC1/StrS family aminotransferase [Candidatus Melainabacteria bacterium]